MRHSKIMCSARIPFTFLRGCASDVSVSSDMSSSSIELCFSISSLLDRDDCVSDSEISRFLFLFLLFFSKAESAVLLLFCFAVCSITATLLSSSGSSLSNRVK